jgi:hypothetical protein
MVMLKMPPFCGTAAALPACLALLLGPLGARLRAADWRLEHCYPPVIAPAAASLSITDATWRHRICFKERALMTLLTVWLPELPPCPMLRMQEWNMPREVC